MEAWICIYSLTQTAEQTVLVENESFTVFREKFGLFLNRLQSFLDPARTVIAPR